MKLKNKILIITLIFVAIILLNNKTFATVTKEDLPKLPESLQEFIKDKYYVITLQPANNSVLDYFICEKPLLYLSYVDDYHNILQHQGWYDDIFIPNTDYCKTYHFCYNMGSSKIYTDSGNEYSDNLDYIKCYGNFKINDINYYGRSNTIISILDSNFDVYCFNKSRDSNNNIIFDFKTKNLVFQAPPQGLTQVLEEGYQTAQKITTQSITQQLGVLVPVGIVIMATLILVSLIAYFRFWRQ